MNPSKRIVGAAGELCLCKKPVPDAEYGDRCGYCFKIFNEDEIPDLSLPENRHLLIEYVEKICDTERKRIRMEDSLNNELERVKSSPLDFDIIVAPNEAIMTALCRVIEEKSDELDG